MSADPLTRAQVQKFVVGDPRLVVHMFDLERDFSQSRVIDNLGKSGRPITAAEFGRIVGKKPEPRIVHGVELWMADLQGITPCEIARRKLQEAGYEAHSAMAIVAAVRASEETKDGADVD